MGSFRRWADLPPDLLCRIGDRLDHLKWYASARGACTAWRGALVAPSPALLVIAAADGDRLCPYAASLPTRRSFELTAIVSGCRCVGSSNGWLALSVKNSGLVLLNPIAAVEIVLPPLIYGHRQNETRCDWVSKVVFAPSPAEDDFAAAAICDIGRIAYVTAGAKRWAVMDPVRLTREVGDQLTDVVYTEKGNKVYCLSKCGDVHVLRLPKRRRRKPANADQAGLSEPEFSVLPPPPPPPPPTPPPLLPPPTAPPTAVHQHNQPCWQYQEPPLRKVPTIHFPYDDEYEQVLPESQGPHLNAPATLEPLLPLFDPATVIAPPYGTVWAFTSAKNLVLCEGNLYQVWRNASCAVTLQLPAGGQRRVAENEILVLRYFPRRRQPCWDVVKDLGGYSFFVGRNNAVSMYAEGLPGLRGNCVYWIGGRGRDQGMVFDMESGRSTPCGVPHAAGFLPGGHPYSTICWYFMSDVMSINSSSSSG